MTLRRSIVTRPRLELLRALDVTQGGWPSSHMPIPTRRLATQMQRDGLVEWRAQPGATRHSLANQNCYITQCGRDIVRSWSGNGELTSDD